MIRKPILLLIALVIFLGGCKKALIAFYGIKKPRIENYRSEKKTLEKYRLPTDEIIAFRDSSGIYKVSMWEIGIPDAAFFNSNGYFIPYLNDTVTCNAGVTSFIKSLKHGAVHQVDSSRHIGEILPELVTTMDGMPLDPSDPADRFDYQVVFFWAVYTGKLTGDKVYEWHSALRDPELSGLKIRVYYVNLDYQEFWGYNEANKPNVRLYR